MANNKIKVLAYCDSPTCATGFATVSRNILMGLVDTGRYDVTVLGINYWGTPHSYPIPIYPTGINQDNDPYGRKWVAGMLQKMDYQILFTLQDSFILEFMDQVMPELRQRKPDFKWITYFPVDGKPKAKWINAMSQADYSFTYTDWARKECEQAYPPCAGRTGVMPHGVNIKNFFPAPKADVEHFRKSYFGKASDRFIVLDVNRNQQRKDIPRAMLAFKRFKEQRPGSALYLHMATQDHGWDLLQVAESLGLVVNEDVFFPGDFSPNGGYPIDVLNLIYNAADCVISTTVGEGWGLSSVEAMACCKPVIFPDNTACSEIVGKDRGILIRSGWDDSAFTVLPHDNEVLRPLAHVGDMVDALVKLYDDPSLRRTLGLNGYKWVTSSLRWDKHVVPKWVEIFDTAATDTTKRSLSPVLSAVEV